MMKYPQYRIAETLSDVSIDGLDRLVEKWVGFANLYRVMGDEASAEEIGAWANYFARLRQLLADGVTLHQIRAIERGWKLPVWKRSPPQKHEIL